MRIKVKRFLGILLSLALVLGLLPGVSRTALAAQPVTYVDADGVSSNVDESRSSVKADDTAWNDGWYVVDGDVTNNNRIVVKGTVNLVLCDNATLTAKAGITVTGDNSLTIYGQSGGTGKLIAGESVGQGASAAKSSRMVERLPSTAVR